jgi:bacillithiol system protein YtxJ
MSKSAEAETQFIPVTDAQELEELFARSHSQPVILFKHSTTCPISAAAYQQMSRSGSAVALVVVQRARDISRQVETLTGVRHESPQAIILRNGQAVWSAAHWDVTADAVKSALGEHG